MYHHPQMVRASRTSAHNLPLRTLLAASTAMLLAVPAHAQEVAEVSNDDIVVTAQKRSERLQDVPISITAVSGPALEKRGMTQVSQLAQVVPSMRIDYSGNYVQPSIRGIGSQVAGPGFYSNIPVYVDGFYIPSATSSDLNLINISGVNVLKGPQGTLFGFNATGGAIQITTLDPVFEPTATIRLGYASFNKISAGAYASTGITSNLAISAGASYDYGTGYITNVANGDKNAGEHRNWSARAKILWEPSDNVSFRLAYSHTENDDPTVNLTNPRDGATVGSVIPGNTIVTGPREVALNAPTYIRLNTDSVTLTGRFDLGFADLTSYSQYRSDRVSQGLDYDSTGANVHAAQWSIPDTTYTQEFNLTSKSGGPLTWVVGAFYLHTENVYNFALSDPNSPDGSGEPFADFFTTTNKNDSYALFADATYEVVENLFVTAGARYTWDNPSLSYNLLQFGVTDSGSVSFKNFSPRAVVRYQLTPQSNVYASFTKGYKSGTLPGSSFSLVPVEPEKIDAYEVGFKTGSGPLRFSLAAFYYDYRDIQVTAYGANGSSITRNAAAANIYGIDGEVSYRFSDAFDINLAAAYVHSEYEDFPDAIGFEQILDPSNPAFPTFVGINIPATGFVVQRTPEFSGSIGANYRLNLGGGELTLNGNLFYTTKFYFDAVKQLPQSDYALLNLRATWTDPSDSFDLAIFATNVTNTEYRTQNFTDTFASRQVWGEPRVIGGQVTFRY